jgi:hypothetical protein
MNVLTYMFPYDFFIFAFFLQFLHNVLGRDQNLGVLLQQLGKILEQGVLRPQEVELEKLQ